MNTSNLMYAALGSGLVALLFAWWKTQWINRQDPGTARMQEIGAAVREGAMAFLRREYRVLALVVVVVAVILAAINSGPVRLVSLAFVFGAFCSALSGFFGMRVATAANMRTTHAARTGLPAALQVAFSGGAVMGMSVVGLGLTGLTVTLMVLLKRFGVETDGVLELAGMKDTILPILAGFSMGASSIALFARVGGGIYTKAADVGADLVGKVEAGIPEDDPATRR
jgi:K(+)-stimulated pyrophosphate-energized sodium pump